MTLLRTVDLAPGLRLRPGLFGDVASLEVAVTTAAGGGLTRADGNDIGVGLAADIDSAGGLLVRIGLDELAAATLELALADEALTR